MRRLALCLLPASIAAGQPIFPEYIAYPGDILPISQLEVVQCRAGSQSPDGELLALQANLKDASTGHSIEGLWLVTTGGTEWQRIAAGWDPAPGTEPETTFDVSITAFRYHLASNDGSVVFQARLRGPATTAANRDGIWIWQSGELRKLLRNGDPVPGLGPDIRFGRDPAFSQTPPTLFGHTLDGEFAFFADIHGPGINEANDRTIWLTRDSVPALVLREGDPAPGAGDIFRRLRHPIAGPSGAIAVTGSVTGFTDDGVWIADDTGVHAVGVWGEPAPGLTDVRFGEFGWEPMIGANGEALIDAQLQGPAVTSDNGSAVFRGRPGDMKLLMRAGDPAPGFSSGTIVQPLPVAISPEGDAIVTAAIAPAYHRALWRFDSSGSPELLVRSDDPTPAGDGVFLAWTGAPQVEISAAGALATLRYRRDGKDQDGLFYFPFGGGAAQQVLPPGQLVRVRPGVADQVRGCWLLDRSLKHPGESIRLSAGGVATVTLGFQTFLDNGIYRIRLGRCAADCDGSGALTFFDFLCFQNQFAARAPEADCDASGSLDLFDFLCFQDAFAAGCQ